MIRFFNNLKIIQKFIVLFSFIGILIFSFLFIFILPQFDKILLVEKKNGLKGNVEVVYNLINEYNQRYLKGEFTLSEAKLRAQKRISQLRYQNGTNYFWINDTYPKMIMHPTNPKLDGTDLSNFSDPNGVKLFSLMKDVCLKNEEGFVEYQWKKPNTEFASDKVSYVKLFKPWNWIIGTGIWVNDIDLILKEEINNTYFYSIVFSGIIITIVIILLTLFASKLSNDLSKISLLASKISKGDFSDF